MYDLYVVVEEGTFCQQEHDITWGELLAMERQDLDKVTQHIFTQGFTSFSSVTDIKG